MKFPPRAQSDSYEGVGHFLRLKDGDKVTGILIGELHEFYAKGFGAQTEIVGPNEGGKRKYRHNLVIKEGKDYVAKVWEFGPKIYDQLSDFEAAGWDLKKTLITVSRTGTTKENTRYTVTPNKQEPSELALKAMSAIVPRALESKPQVASPQGQTGNEEF